MNAGNLNNTIEIHYNPKVSMLRSVHYVTPNWDHFLNEGPLTDARIFEYEKLGRYGTERQIAALEQQRYLDEQRAERFDKARKMARQLRDIEKHVDTLLSSL